MLKHVHRRVTRHIGPALHIGPRSSLQDNSRKIVISVQEVETTIFLYAW